MILNRTCWLAALVGAFALAACEGGGHEAPPDADVGADADADAEGGADGDAADADADVEPDDGAGPDADADAEADGDADDGDTDAPPLPCNTCHGNADSPAPPTTLAGASATTDRGVGAHRSHLRVSDWHLNVACNDCHLVPTALLDPGHIDTDLPAELTWSARARADGATPAFDGTSCGRVYCHGSTLLPGGSDTTPQWTLVDGSQKACGTCHGLPPGGSHPPMTTCEYCHSEVVQADRSFLDPTLHIDGTVQSGDVHPDGWYVSPGGGTHGGVVNADGLAPCATCHGADFLGGISGTSCETCHPGWQTSCTFCHGGTDNMTGAPPEGVDGETARTDLAVGAHTSHVQDTPIHFAYACNRCHVMPASATSPGHIDGDGRAELDFDPLNPSAAYDGATGRCSSLYCHGNGRASNGSIVWNTDPAITCASCHNDETTSEASFTMSGRHWDHVGDSGIRCNACHSTVVNSSKVIIDRAQHIDGNPDVSLLAPGTYDPGTTSCDPACHGPETWWL